MYTSEHPIINVTVDAAITSNVEVLLIRRKNDPFKDKLAMPGGFINPDETAAQAIIRELKEETGLIFLESDLYPDEIADNPDRDPRGRTISLVYALYVPDHKMQEIKAFAKAGDDAKEVIFMDIKEAWNTDKSEFAFDHHYLLFGK